MFYLKPTLDNIPPTLNIQVGMEYSRDWLFRLQYWHERQDDLTNLEKTSAGEVVGDVVKSARRQDGTCSERPFENNQVEPLIAHVR